MVAAAVEAAVRVGAVAEGVAAVAAEPVFHKASISKPQEIFL